MYINKYNWTINTGKWNGISMLHSNESYSFKVHKTYEFLPIDFKNFSHFIPYINWQECDNFTGKKLIIKDIIDPPVMIF